MEAGDSIVPEDDDQPRGGILSALESARHRKPLPHIRGETVPKKSAWSSRPLVGLLATGVAALLGGFIMVVRDGHSEAAARDAALAQAVATQAPAVSTTAAAREVNALPAAAAGLPMASASTATATVIEAPAANPLSALGVAPGLAAPVAAAAQVANPAVTQVVATGSARSPATGTVPATTGRAITAKADSSPKTVTNAAGSDKVARVSKKRQADADVALLEAMFHHTQAHPPAAGPSVTDQIRSACGSLAGAAAATCRARICVNNPSARACHDGE